MSQTMIAAARTINGIADYIILLVSFALGCLTRYFIGISGTSSLLQFDVKSFVLLFIIFYTSNYLSLSFNGAYPTTRLRSYGDMAAIYFKSILMALAAVALISYFVYPLVSSRLLIFSSSLYAFLMLLAKEFGMRRLLAYLRGRGFNIKNTILIGSNEQLINETMSEVEHNPLLGLNVIGVVTSAEEESETRFDRLPCLGRIDGLIKIVEDNVVDHVIFLVHGPDKRAIEKAIWECEERGLEVWMRLGMRDYLHLAGFGENKAAGRQDRRPK